MDRHLALGFFDGVHIGHGALLSLTKASANQTGGISCALTFDTHPQSAVSGNRVPLLTSVADRSQLMRQLYGIDEIIILPFTEQLMRTTWQVFLRQLLVDTYKVTHIVVGHDFHFGYREEGNGRRLRNECARLGIQCDVIPKVELDGITVSSTYIRGLVAQGDMERAQTFLGHPHVMTGIIARDKKIGRTIGYPTANLKTQPGILMPAFGSYVSRFVIAGTTYQAMTNIGIRPTFYKSDEVTIETNIFDFNQQAYDLPASVELLTRMRPEQRFSSKEDLQQQLRLDEEIARKWHLDHS